MKYYIAIDKGEFYSRDERYHNLSLAKIGQELNNCSLTKENNLASLTTFTMTFNNPSEIKAFLIAKKVIPENLKYYDLVLISEEMNNKHKKIDNFMIPYKCHEKYLNIDTLTKIIYRHAKKAKSFLPKFLNEVAYRYRSKEYYDLKKTDIASPDLLAKIKSFLISLNTDFANNLSNYQGLFEAGMYLAIYDKVIPPKVNLTPSPVVEEKNPDYNKPNYNELDYDENNQFRLF